MSWPRLGWRYVWCLHKDGEPVEITTFGDLPWCVLMCVTCGGLRVFLAGNA